MNYGPSRILTCPYCETKKEVMSLLSGNTSGGVVWSDQYVEYPFYKKPSDVQKCPHCGEFYMIDEEIEYALSPSMMKYVSTDEDEYSDNSCFLILNTQCYDWNKSSSITGMLDFKDMHNALLQLDREIKDESMKKKLYFNFINRFNSHFFRNNTDGKAPTPLLWYLFVAIAKIYISKAADYEIIFVAELYREIGAYDKCLHILNSKKEELQDQHSEFIEMLTERAKNEDNSIFIWKTIKKEESNIYIRQMPNGLPIPGIPY